MTGAIITQFHREDEKGEYSRYCLNGSFFFIKPDVAVTAYVNLTEHRKSYGWNYGDDYFYFNSGREPLNSSVKNKDAVRCIRLRREWLVEYPERNITEIHFPEPMTSEFFQVSAKGAVDGQGIMCEGFDCKDNLSLEADPDSIDFLCLSKKEERKIKLYRQDAFIEDLIERDCI